MCRNWFIGFVLAGLVSGCNLLGGVKLKELAGASSPPAQVTKVIAITRDGAPVATLRSSAFRVEEDGQALDSNAVGLRLIPPEEVIAFHTVLLLDLGAFKSSEERKQLAEAVRRFVQRLRVRQTVTVLGFDGSGQSRLIGEFAQSPTAGETSIVESRLGSATDPSRDLRGAVVDGLDRLETNLRRSTLPVRVGSLVVFTAGPDAAGRVTAAALENRLAQSESHTYAIGLKENEWDDTLGAVGKDGKALAADLPHVFEAFDAVSELVESAAGGYYVLSYCSLSRSGERRLRVVADVVSDDLEVSSGVLDSSFDATGFGAGCSANARPQLAAFKARDVTTSNRP